MIELHRLSRTNPRRQESVGRHDRVASSITNKPQAS
uniref:Uncharacterized protein n=1 Tax=Cucumis melo TaxID=3656 RepID=A0A9I9E3X6_CUCME